MTGIRWKYIWPYLVFIITIGILVLVNAGSIENAIDTSTSNAHLINLAGRQRMLSQRLTSLSLQQERLGQPIRGIDSLALVWNEVQQALVLGDTRYDIEPVQDEHIVTMLGLMEPVQQQMYAKVVRATTHPQDKAVTDSIILLQSQYLPAMDSVVSEFERQSVASFAYIRERQVRIAFISGLILILEILVLVIPFHRKLIYAFRELKKQKVLIEEQNEEIAQQVHELASQNKLLDEMHRTEDLTLKGINAGVWNWHIQTGWEEWSDKFYTLLGYEPQEMLATFETFMNKLLHPDDKDAVQKAISDHLENDAPFRLNVRMRNKDGNYRWYETAGKVLRNQQGEAIQMAGSIIDVHERVNYRKELEGLNETKGKLLAIIAHDLRSPINSFKSLVEMQSHGLLTPDEYAVYSEQLKQHLTFLSDTLDNMLHWAMGQMQGFKQNPVRLNLGDVVEDVKKFYAGVAEQKGVRLHMDTGREHYVMADKDHVFLAVRNIVNNAIKFTPAGGSVTVSLHREGKMEQVIITDTGVGISQKEIDSILQRGELSSTRGTEGEKGTGLGMTLTMDVLKDNGGSLSISSHPGLGSCFVVALPAV